MRLTACIGRQIMAIAMQAGPSLKTFQAEKMAKG
jgi:hypothetical protein